jgi:hypothetical protein
VPGRDGGSLRRAGFNEEVVMTDHLKKAFDRMINTVDLQDMKFLIGEIEKNRRIIIMLVNFLSSSGYLNQDMIKQIRDEFLEKKS